MLQRLNLRNVGPHRRLELKFRPGVIGILGANGSGKTWVLNAIHLLLTGDFGRFGGTKDQCVCLAADAADAAYVEGWFRLGEQDTYLRRGLRGTTSVLQLDGQEFRKREEIHRELVRGLGVPLKTVSTAAFRAQGELDDVVHMPPAARLELLRDLAGLTYCEKIVALLGQHAAVDEQAIALVPDDTDAANAEAVQLKSAFDAHQHEAAVLTRQLLKPEGRRQRQQVIDQAAQAERAAQTQATATRLRDQAQAEVAAANAEALHVQRARAAAVAAAAQTISKRPSAEAVVAAARAAAQTAAQRQRWEVQLQAAEQGMAELEQHGSCWPEELVARAARLDALCQRQRQREAAALKISRLPADAACPTCGTAVANLRAVRRRAALLLQQKRSARWQATLQTWQARVQERQQYLRDEQEFQRQYDQAKTALAALEAVPAPPSARVRAAEQFIARDDRNQLALRQAESAWAAAQARQTAAERALAQADNYVVLEAPPAPPPARVARARQDLAADEQRRRQLAVLQGRVEAAKQALAQSAARIERARVQQQRVAGLVNRAGILRSVREVFRELPARVVTGLLDRTIERMNGWLDRFGNPFAVARAADGLELLACKPGWPPHPATMLSGAQTAIVGLAFWLSVDARLPLLVLDEPTAFLDARNRAELRGVITQLAGAARQMFITTHAEDLRPAFDQVVQLPL